MTAPHTPNWLAKDCLDVGIYTNNLEGMLAFWQNDVGLKFDHMLPVGSGVRQHRHDHQGSVFKLNHTRSPLPDRTPGGYQRLLIASEKVSTPTDLMDPDGNKIVLVPKGYDQVDQWAIELVAKDVDQFFDFYHSAIGLPIDPKLDCAVRCGRSLIIAKCDADLAEQSEPSDMQRRGYRYTTIQVEKVDAVHTGAVAAGATEGRAPVTLGKTARISFVRDGCGNWMELSQRASLTGSLSP